MTLPPLERPKVLPFRPRGGQQVRYRRRHPLRLILPFVLALTIVGLPLGAAWWLATTPRLAFAELEMTTEPAPGEPARLERVWVERRLRPLFGHNLLRLELDAVRARLAAHPWVARVALRKELPHRLRIVAVERRPAMLYQARDALVYVDGDGRPIAPWRAGETVDLPLVREEEPAALADLGDRQSRLRAALELTRELEAVRPAWAAALSEIGILGAQDFELMVDGLPFPVLVRARALARRLPRLEALLPQIDLRYEAVQAVDLRFARRIIVQPAAPTTAPRRPSSDGA